MEEAVRGQWGSGLIRSWNEGWLEAPARIGEKIARLVRAGAGQVVLGNSTSVNLYKLASAALDLRPGRGMILTDTLNFPSDLYILQGIAQARGLRLERVPSPDGMAGPSADILEAIDEQTALVTLSQVVFKSGYLYDAAAITRRPTRQARWCSGTSATRPEPCGWSWKAGAQISPSAAPTNISTAARARRPSCTCALPSRRTCVRRSGAGSATAARSLLGVYSSPPTGSSAF